MFKSKKETLDALGASITTSEISQQPGLWSEAYELFKGYEPKLKAFIDDFSKTANQKIRVIFTGAGTSAYVGDVIKPHLVRYGSTDKFSFEAIPTTDIVSAPYDYLIANQPTLLVSFARSGNSPESVATVSLANEILKDVRHLVITCAPTGQLAQNCANDANSMVLLMPAGSNDQGFAMTGSFTCMTLTALLVFDETNTDRDRIISTMVKLGEEALFCEETVQTIVDKKFNRVVYLGSGSLSGLTREAQLKLLELTAGAVATAFDSSMGFRHGPKSFVDDKTIIFGFISNDPYSKQYDVDILEEIRGNQIAVEVIAIEQNVSSYQGSSIDLKDDYILPDAYAALPFVLVAQTFALLTSVKLGNKPDTPSPTGTVNRVVKGVTIHPLNA